MSDNSKWLFLLVTATNSTDLIRTHGNGQEKIYVHLTSRIRYAHGLDTHTWKHSLTLVDYATRYPETVPHKKITT